MLSIEIYIFLDRRSRNINQFYAIHVINVKQVTSNLSINIGRRSIDEIIFQSDEDNIFAVRSLGIKAST